MIQIKKSNKADSRTSNGVVSRKELLDNTLSHIQDVENGCSLIAEKLVEQSQKHDFTKRAFFDEFYADFTSGMVNEEFKKLNWWKIHSTKERHHLLDRTPEDVNLIDVIEYLVDGCMAGMARSGECYDIQLTDEILQSAFHNTQNMILDNIEVEGEVE